MKIIRPQQCIVLRNAYQLGDQAMLGVSVIAGWHLDDPWRFLNEPAIWHAHQSAPMTFRMLDAAEPKPFAEFLLAGHAYPDTTGRNAAIDIRVGAVHKRIAALGHRPHNASWAQGAPFERIAIDHVNAWGGPGIKENPVGLGGDRKHGSDENQPASLPRLLLMHVDGSLDERSPLAATTPLPHLFKARSAHLGNISAGFGGNYLKTTYPGMPASVDSRYFQMAAPDQWLETAEWPDETSYHLQGLTAGGQAISGHIAAVRPRVLAWLKNSPDAPTEFAMQRKTLWFLPDAGYGLMVFTGALALRHLLDEPVGDLLVALEASQQPRPQQYYVQERNRRCAADATGFESMLDDQLMPETARLDVIATLGDHPSSQYYQSAVPSSDAASSHYADIRESIAANRKETQDNPAPGPVAVTLPATDYGGTKDWTTILSDARPAPDLHIINAQLSGEDFSGKIFIRVIFDDCIIDHVNFSNSQFDACQFNDCDIQNSSFQQAKLQDTHIQGSTIALANFNAAEFSRGGIDNCLLLENTFSETKMWQVSIDDSTLRQCSFSEAILDALIASQSRFEASHFKHCSIEACTFEQCLFRDCSDVESSFERCSVFQGAWDGFSFFNTAFHSMTFAFPFTLSGSKFEQSNLKKIGMFKAQLRNTSFIHCDFHEMCLSDACIDETDFKQCVCPGILLKNSRLQRVMFTQSNLQQANMYGADLSLTRFTECILSGADLAWTRQAADTVFENCLQSGTRFLPLYKEDTRENT